LCNGNDTPLGIARQDPALLGKKKDSLVVPKANAAEEAGKLLRNLPRLWSKANQEEKRKLLLTMLDAVYVDAKKNKSIVAIRPKPPFKPVFQVAASKKGSNIRILNEPLEGSSVFLVEPGESRTPSNPPILALLKQRKALVIKFNK
jgi:site-specific DNA recombinase